MSIDWSKAPKDATHWEPDSPQVFGSWMKKEGNSWFWWNEGVGGWSPSHSSEQRMWSFEARPQDTWDGQGLPPAGLLVEWKAGLDHEWRRVTVLAYANGDAWLQPEDGDSFIVGNPANFRRIRTPEQIAAEQRRKDIIELANVIRDAGDGNDYMLAEALHDAGYRKKESDHD